VDPGIGLARAAPPALRRDLGLLDAVGVGFGAIIGAGIFVVTGVAAGIAGPSLLVGLFVAAIAATANALSSAQLAARYPQSGGTYEYGYQVLSPTVGFVAGWMFLASKIAAAGTVAKGLAGYVASMAPDLPPGAVSAGAIAAFTALNYVGVKRSSRVNLAIVSVTITALVALVAGGVSSFRLEHLQPFAPGGWQATAEAAALLFFAYTGYARIATLAEEVHDPRRTIPRAIIITIGGAVLLYAAVALVAVGVVGAPALAATTAPLRVVATASGVPGMATIVAIAAVTAMLGVMLSQIVGLSRMVFAMARRGDLPGWLADVHPRYQVPGRAVLAVGAIAMIVAATGTLRGVASAASFTILVYYGIANVAALKMPRDAKLYPDVVPVVGLAGCVALAFALPLSVIATGLALTGAGFIARAIVRAGSPGRA
jgi:APA family basic amino acid/polyamine antiporter